MTNLRTAVTAITLALLCAGYAASQVAYFQGRFAQYAARVDQRPVAMLAGIGLLLAIGLALWRDQSEERREL